MPFFIATSEIYIEDGYYDNRNDDGKMRSLKKYFTGNPEWLAFIPGFCLFLQG
jgi:hypothetical protein